jgi:hypothetical protein
VIAGRIRLSRLTADTLASMSAWLPSALSPEWTLTDLERALPNADGVLISDTAGEPIGLAVVRAESPAPRCASIPLITIEPSRRFRGLGGEAGIALSQALQEQGFSVFAPVPDGRGLAVYFWLRLGFRPLLAGESPGPVIGLTGEPIAGIWMMRESPAD